MRYAIAVAEERNFTRAAQRCHVVQSALSAQIIALERELDVALFVRSSRRVELTEAGAAFVAQARVAVDAADQAVSAAVAATTAELRGTVAVAAIPTVTAVDLAVLLGSFHRAHPAVTISLRAGGSDEFVADLRSGALDVAFVGYPDESPPSGVSAMRLDRHRLVAVLPASHPLAQRGSLRLGDLTGVDFVDFPAGTPGRAPADNAFAAAGILRRVAFEARDITFMVGLVRSGLAVALLPPAVAPADDGVVAVPVADGPWRAEYVAWSAFNPRAVALALVDMIGSVAPRR